MSEQKWSYLPTRWGVDNETYHADTTAESSTTIRDFLTSEKLYKAKYVDGVIPRKEAKHLALGTLVHEMLLEGRELTDARYVMIPKAIASMDKRTKKYKETYAEWDSVQPNLPKVDPEVWKTAHAMVRAAEEHPIARGIMLGCIETELGMRWIDSHSEIPVKVRLDMLSDWGGPTVVEFKSDRRPTQFARSVFEHGYHIQAELYRNAAEGFDDPVMEEAFGPLKFRPPCRHVFIVVDNQQPYQCEVFQIGQAAMDMAENDIRYALGRMAAIRDGEAYRESETSEKIGEIQVPLWYKPRSAESDS